MLSMVFLGGAEVMGTCIHCGCYGVRPGMSCDKCRQHILKQQIEKKQCPRCGSKEKELINFGCDWKCMRCNNIYERNF